MSSGSTISPGIIRVAASGNRVVERDELCAVGERRLDLDVVNHFRNAIHDLRAGQHVRAGFHERPRTRHSVLRHIFWDGAPREHAVFGNDQCASAHPSDIAAAGSTCAESACGRAP